MRALALAAAIALPGLPRADWTATDAAFQLALTAVIAVDWMQTADFRTRGWSEANPLLGAYPSPQRVNLMIGGAMVGSWVLAYILPQPYRRVFQVVVLTAEIATVARNARLGCGLRIPF